MEITVPLRSALARLYFEEDCRQKGWAFASAESIYNAGAWFKDDAAISFRYGNQSVKVKIIDKIVSEVREICRPVDRESHEFLFSYLVCKLGSQVDQSATVVANPTAISWVLIKGSKEFTERQIDVLASLKLPLTLFSIRDLLVPPRDIETRWDTRSGSEWLDFFDELKEQEEYDDEYF